MFPILPLFSSLITTSLFSVSVVLFCFVLFTVSFYRGFQVALVLKILPTNAGHIRNAGSIPGLGRSPGGGHGNLLQYSRLENPMDRGAWGVTVHRVAQSWT